MSAAASSSGAMGPVIRWTEPAVPATPSRCIMTEVAFWYSLRRQKEIVNGSEERAKR